MRFSDISWYFLGKVFLQCIQPQRQTVHSSVSYDCNLDTFHSSQSPSDGCNDDDDDDTNIVGDDIDTFLTVEVMLLLWVTVVQPKYPTPRRLHETW